MIVYMDMQDHRCALHFQFSWDFSVEMQNTFASMVFVIMMHLAGPLQRHRVLFSTVGLTDGTENAVPHGGTYLGQDMMNIWRVPGNN